MKKKKLNEKIEVGLGKDNCVLIDKEKKKVEFSFSTEEVLKLYAYLRDFLKLVYPPEDFVKYLFRRIATGDKEVIENFEKFSLEGLWKLYRNDFVNYLEQKGGKND